MNQELYNLAYTGNAEAQNELGLAYLQGIHSFEQDEQQGIEWLTKAAHQGNTTAMFNLGLAYQELADQGINRDEHIKLALHFYHQAANLGDSSAQYQLGQAYMSHMGVTHDVDRAIYWYQKAANQHDADAQFALAELFLGKYNGPVNLIEAEMLLNHAAEQGCIPAQVVLARLLELGDKLTQDVVRAAYWYGQLLEQKFPLDKPQINLIGLYAPQSIVFTIANKIFADLGDTEQNLASIERFSDFIRDIADSFNQNPKRRFDLPMPEIEMLNKWHKKLAKRYNPLMA